MYQSPVHENGVLCTRVSQWGQTCVLEQIELQAKLLNYFLGSNKSNINQYRGLAKMYQGFGARAGTPVYFRGNTGTPVKTCNLWKL